MIDSDSRLFNRFDIDHRFVLWCEQRKMRRMRLHYSSCLTKLRQTDKPAYDALRFVVFRWLDLAFMQYGQELLTNQSAPPTRLDENCLNEEVYYNHPLIQGTLSGQKNETLPELSSWVYCGYRFDIITNNSQTCLKYGLMPVNITTNLLDWLLENMFEKFVPNLSI